MLLGFKYQFVAPIRAGTKDQTIRIERKDGKRPVPGETLYLYTRLRTKLSEKIGEAICTECLRIRITDDGAPEDLPAGIVIDGHRLNSEEMLATVQRDGFNSTTEFYDLFRTMHTFPFEGFVTRWTDFKLP